MAYEDTIRLYRGNKSGLPTVLDGEPVWAHDTGELYVGGRYGNVRIGYGITPEAYGAKGDGTTDDTAAINSAATAAASAGQTLVWGGGKTYRISSKVTLLCDCLDLGAKIDVYGNPAIAIVVGYDSVTTPTDSLFGWRAGKRVELPDIENKAKPATGWTGCGTGVLVGNVFESELHFKWVYGFEKGVRCYAAAATSAGAGVCFNDIFVGHLEDNKIALELDAGDYGFVNENNFYNGRYHIQGAEGSEIAGTRFIQLGTETGWTSPAACGANNNCFYKPCLEGDGPEYHVEFYGSLNHIEYGRWEVSAVQPKIHFGVVGGSYSNGNVIFYGYGADFAITNDTGAYNNIIFNREGIAIESSQTARSTMTLANAAGAAYSSLRIVDSNERPWGDHSADYSFDLSSRYLKMKQNGDTYPRLQVDGTGGSISFGDGTAAPASAINYTEAVYLDGQDQPVRSDSQVTFNKVFLDSLASGKVPYHSVTEKLTDGGLEAWDSATALTSWTEEIAGTSTVNRETTSPHAGTYCCRFDTDALDSIARIDQTLTLTASTRYRFTYWYKNAAGKTLAWQITDNTTPGSPAVYLNSNGTWQASPTAVAPASATSWTKYELYFTTHADHTAYRVYIGTLYGTNASSSNYIDDVSLSEVAGFVDSPLTTDGTDVDNSGVYKVDGVQVVGNQGAAVADATGAGDVVAQLNALLARLRTHGLIAT